ncbi:MAG: hypothetical protein LBG84_07910 [Treponema sp.]|jgi:chromosome segregation ATPase|nr:hypothetical protein [Treponema sp.]
MSAMAANEDIEVFSEEERREISARIEAASAREAIAPARPPARGEAAKGGFFPLAVNIAAVVLLGAGLFCLFSFQRTDTAEIRETGAVLGIAERALIQEIRKEAGQRISEKEAAINSMSGRLAEVDAELERLESLEELSAEQRAAAEGLRRQREEYQGSLTQLQSERSQILAGARRREAELFAQRETAEDPLQDRSSQSEGEPPNAREELARLSGEDEKAALIERQIGGYYTALAGQIQEGRYGEASQTLAALRDFLSTPSFQTVKRIQARRESDIAAAAAFSALIAEAQKPGGAPAQNTPAPAQSPAAEAGTAGAEEALRRQLAAQSAAASQNAAASAQTQAALERQTAELRKSLADLEVRASEAQRIIAERDAQIANLNTQVSAQNQNIQRLQRTIDAIRTGLESQ